MDMSFGRETRSRKSILFAWCRGQEKENVPHVQSAHGVVVSIYKVNKRSKMTFFYVFSTSEISTMLA